MTDNDDVIVPAPLPTTLPDRPLIIGRLGDPVLQAALDDALVGIEPGAGKISVTFKVESKDGHLKPAVYAAFVESFNKHFSVKGIGKIEWDGDHPDVAVAIVGNAAW